MHALQSDSSNYAIRAQNKLPQQKLNDVMLTLMLPAALPEQRTVSAAKCASMPPLLASTTVEPWEARPPAASCSPCDTTTARQQQVNSRSNI
jgi:hypothetical protein